MVLSFNTMAESKWEFEFDLTTVQLEHAWRGPNNYAQFEESISGIGLTGWHKSGFGTRIGYLEGKDLTTEGKYSDVTLSLGYIASWELLYRKEVFDGLFLIGGIGTHIIPIPNLASSDPHHSTDYDNDEGYILGLQWTVNDKMSVGWRFTHYSRITVSPYDEWTKGHSFNITYKF